MVAMTAISTASMLELDWLNPTGHYFKATLEGRGLGPAFL